MKQLPEMAVLLIRLIGQEAALRMMEAKAYGGKDFTVPKGEVGRGEQTFAALVDIVGIDNAKEVCKQFGGACIYVPLLSRLHLAERNRAIVAAYNAKEKSVWQLASEHQMSERQIWNILKRTDMGQNSEALIDAAQNVLF